MGTERRTSLLLMSLSTHDTYLAPLIHQIPTVRCASLLTSHSIHLRASVAFNHSIVTVPCRSLRMDRRIHGAAFHRVSPLERA